MKKIKILLAVSLILCFPVSAFAYLDPGTGSYVLQVLIAVAVSGAFVVKTFWKTLKEKVGQLFKKDQ